jgi:hypothetical protein
MICKIKGGKEYSWPPIGFREWPPHHKDEVRD